MAESCVISMAAPPATRLARAELHRLWRSPARPSPGAAEVLRIRPGLHACWGLVSWPSW